MTNDIAMICREGGIVFYHMTEVPKALAKEDFTEKIRSVFYSSDYTGVVLEKASGAGEKQLIMYQNTKGKKVLNMDFTGEYKGIYTSGEDIVYYDSGRLTIYNMKGKQKLRVKIEKNVNAVFRVDDGTRYILIGDETAEIVRLKQVEEKEPSE